MSSFTTIYDALKATVQRRGSAPALIFKDECVTYDQLRDRIDSIAEVLRREEIRVGDPFAVYAQNCLEVIYCYYAAAKVGAIYVPINPNMTLTEVRYIVTHCGAKRLFVDEGSHAQSFAGIPADTLRPLSALTTTQRASALPGSFPAVSGEDGCLIIYTSGSTGDPKAVLLDHRSQVDVCDSLMEMWGMTERDTTLVALPLGYLYGLSTAAGVGLRAGGVVVVFPKFRPKDVLEGFFSARATVFHGVPTMFSMMLEYVEQNAISFDLSGVRQMISAGAPLGDELITRFEATFNKKLQNYYAMTECTPVFGKYASDLVPLPAGSIGKPAPGTSVRVVAPDGADCDVGVDGEFVVRGAATMRGYYKNPKLTASVLKDGWFMSGDMGHRDEHGYYYITGRIKEIIIRGGANVAPAEVERVLGRHPCVQDVAVVGAPDRMFGEVPVAFIVPRAQATVTAEELIKHAEHDLADFKIPQRYYFLEVLPVGKTGKVDKRALKERHQL